MTIVNSNVYLVENGFGKPPKIYSSFQKAEGVLLDMIRTLNPCGFSFTLVCVQIDTNITCKSVYRGNVKIKDGFKHIVVKRDSNDVMGHKKSHREKIRINLD